MPTDPVAAGSDPVATGIRSGTYGSTCALSADDRRFRGARLLDVGAP